jgi:putative membrane protein
MLWAIVALLLCGSLWETCDLLIWFIEVFWVALILPLLPFIWRRLPFTQLLCWLLTLCALVMIHGGTHTYADAPLGTHLQYIFDFRHNPWDQISHLAQGFGLAILGRELLLRFTAMKRAMALDISILAFCPVFSVTCDFLEWQAARKLGAQTDTFLALQGNVWSMPHMLWDFAFCLLGAAFSLFFLSRIHDRQLGLR